MQTHRTSMMTMSKASETSIFDQRHAEGCRTESLVVLACAPGKKQSAQSIESILRTNQINHLTVRSIYTQYVNRSEMRGTEKNQRDREREREGLKEIKAHISRFAIAISETTYFLAAPIVNCRIIMCDSLIFRSYLFHRRERNNIHKITHHWIRMHRK